MTDKQVLQFRIGEGWDTHALVAGRPLILGGIHIPHSFGLAGHSDADALAKNANPWLHFMATGKKAKKTVQSSGKK